MKSKEKCPNYANSMYIEKQTNIHPFTLADRKYAKLPNHKHKYNPFEKRHKIKKSTGINISIGNLVRLDE